LNGAHAEAKDAATNSAASAEKFQASVESTPLNDAKAETKDAGWDFDDFDDF
jgi:hypothetical protein